MVIFFFFVNDGVCDSVMVNDIERQKKVERNLWGFFFGQEKVYYFIQFFLVWSFSSYFGIMK